MFSRIKNTDGFTLVEILMVMIILGILSQMALMFAGDIRKRAFDATALTDGKNLMTMVGNSFLALDDVTFEHTGDGRDIGTFTADGSPRTTPIFTLSPGVRAEIFHFDPGIPSGKRQFWFSIDEMTSSISAPTM